MMYKKNEEVIITRTVMDIIHENEKAKLLSDNSDIDVWIDVYIYRTGKSLQLPKSYFRKANQQLEFEF